MQVEHCLAKELAVHGESLSDLDHQRRAATDGEGKGTQGK